MNATLPPLAVTGATGQIGGRVAQLLARRGIPQRLIVRDASRAPRIERASAAVADYADATAARDALSGVDTLFMVSAAESPDRLANHLAFIAAAADAGVGHIVYTSFFGAAPDATFTLARDHFATEDAIRATGIAHTFLRDNFYLDFLADLVGEDDLIRGPASTGRVAAVARDDVAAVATEVLVDPDAHRARTLNLTGPEALTMADAADIMTSVWGRPIGYVDETIEQAYESRAGYGAPDWQVDAWVSTYTAIAAGELDDVTSDVESVLGRPPIDLRTLLTR